MDDGFDIREFEKFAKNLLDIADKEMPKESKKFLREEGTKLKRKTLAKAKQKVKKNTGKYYESIKRGKVYYYKPTGSNAIRVYSAAPHGHLIEFGHRAVSGGKLSRGKKKGTGYVVQKDGQEVFVPGKYVFESAQREFTDDFYKDAETFIDEVVVKGVTK